MTHRTIQLPRRAFLALAGRLALVAGCSPRSWAGRANPEAETPRMTLLLDTDIGSDIDDAVALAYLLANPKANLLGITTVTGEAQKRAALAEYLVGLVPQNIPVLAGYEAPQHIASRQPVAQQAVKLNPAVLRALPTTHDPEQAIDFMANTIYAHPNEVTLLAVGPFTNVARLLAREPGISRLLKEIVIMGGKYSDYPTPWGPTEWNAIVDPHATHQLFTLAECPVRAFGLDITWQLSMTPDRVRAQFKQHPLLETVLAWSEVWFEERDLLHFHDPLAALCLFEADLCTYAQGTVSVDLSSPARAGITHFSPASQRPNTMSTKPGVSIATGVNSDLFFERFFQGFQIESRRQSS